MNNIYRLTLILYLFIFTSCNNNESIPNFHLGSIDYYPSFLWFKGDTTSIEKTFEFELSKDAIDNNCSGEIVFVDKEGKDLPSDVLTIKVNDKILTNNIFKFDSSTRSVKFLFTAGKSVHPGRLQGQIRLQNHHFNRFENQILDYEKSIILHKKWSISMHSHWNPVAFYLFIFASIAIFLLLVWLLILKKIFFPCIKLNRIQISSNDYGYYLDQRIYGCRMIIFCIKEKRQNFLNKLFTGKIIYITAPIWKDTWIIKPSPNRKREAKAIFHNNYSVSPIGSTLKNYGKYILTDKQSKTIKIQIF